MADDAPSGESDEFTLPEDLRELDMVMRLPYIIDPTLREKAGSIGEMFRNKVIDAETAAKRLDRLQNQAWENMTEEGFLRLLKAAREQPLIKSWLLKALSDLPSDQMRLLILVLTPVS